MSGFMSKMIRSKMRAARQQTEDVLRRLPDLQADEPRLPLPYI